MYRAVKIAALSHRKVSSPDSKGSQSFLGVDVSRCKKKRGTLYGHNFTGTNLHGLQGLHARLFHKPVAVLGKGGGRKQER